MSKKPRKKCDDPKHPSNELEGEPERTVYWNRVYQKTETDLQRLREYGLSLETPVFRIVQGGREKATLYGNVDCLKNHKPCNLDRLVRDIIEGRPPKEYSPRLPIVTEPCRFFLRRHGRLKKMQEKRPMWTVIDANAEPSPAAMRAMARLLLHIVRRQGEEAVTKESVAD
jgi:hypothetical protein